MNLAELTAAHFRPLVGQPFTLALAPEHVVELRLVEVDEGRPHPALPRVPFRLTFQSSLGPTPAQGTFALSHPALGRLELFLTAIAPGPDGQRFEIVFA